MAGIKPGPSSIRLCTRHLTAKPTYCKKNQYRKKELPVLILFVPWLLRIYFAFHSASRNRGIQHCFDFLNFAATISGKA